VLEKLIALPATANSLSAKLPEPPRCDMTEPSLTFRPNDALLIDLSGRCCVREVGREMGRCLRRAAAADSTTGSWDENIFCERLMEDEGILYR
jgi:hypothetical protein